MTFASPLWFLALALLAPALGARIRASLHRQDAVERFVSPKLRDDLVEGGGGRKRSGWPRFVCLCMAFALAVCALARPQWGEIVREVHGEGRSVIIGIDTSRSMLAADLKPDRLTRAKLAAQDLVDALPEDLIGLMAFSGTAFLQVPITSDRSALSEAIEQMDTYAIARGGTNLSSAIKLASSRFKDTGAKQHALILFTDGEDLEGKAIAEAKKAAADGTIIITIGVGSSAGAIIPDPDARRAGQQFVRDNEGEIVRSKLDTETLENIASASDGLFIHLESKTMNSDLIRRSLSRLDTTMTEAGSKTIPIERYPLPLGLGMLLLGIGIVTRNLTLQRRPAAAIAALLAGVALSIPQTSQAGAIAEAYELYSSGEFESAAERYDEAIEKSRSSAQREQLQLGLGSAAFQSGDHPRAIDAFGKALVSGNTAVQEHAHYNLGNTLFRTGEATLAPAGEPDAETPPSPPSPESIKATLRDWQGAVEHFESTLTLNAEHADAAHNLEVVRRRIEELEQQEQEQEDQKQEDQEKQENEDKPEEGDKGEDGEQPQKPDKGEGEQDQGEEPQPGEGEKGEDDKGDQEQAGEGEDPGKTPEQSGEGEPGEPNGEGTEGQPTDPGEVINPETGYSEEGARRQLEALANEQGDLRPLRRRRARARYFKDW
jgi:Ca-activated chloride channel family protein